MVQEYKMSHNLSSLRGNTEPLTPKVRNVKNTSIKIYKYTYISYKQINDTVNSYYKYI